MPKYLLNFIVLLFTGPVLFAQEIDVKDWSQMVGYWKFDDPSDLLKPEVGQTLKLTGTINSIAGPGVYNPGVRIGPGSYLNARHNIKANGGGDSVNSYTLLFDFKILSLQQWHTFFQTDTSNQNDGECFIRPVSAGNSGKIGTAATGYTMDSVEAGIWYRLVISVNNGQFYRYYVDGKLLLDANIQDIDDRFALLPNVLFFADNNAEDDTIDIASIAIFDTSLNPQQIARLGVADPCRNFSVRSNLGKDTFLCFNQVLLLHAGSNYNQYTWSDGSSQKERIIRNTNETTGKRIFWVEATDSNGCKGRDTILIDFLDHLKPKIGADTSLCFGEKIELDAGNAYLKYTWKQFPSGMILGNGRKISVNTEGYYSVEVSDINGCKSSSTRLINYFPEVPKPEIETKGSTRLCSGDSVEFRSKSSYAEYHWNNGIQSREIRIYNSQNLWLFVKDPNQCVSPASDTIKVEVFNPPPAPLLINSGQDIICERDSALLIAPSGYAGYVWNDGPGNRQKAAFVQGEYYLYVVDANNCKSEPSNIIEINLKAGPTKPSVVIDGSLNFCSGDSVIFYAPSGYQSYLWSNGHKGKELIVKDNGTYRLQVINFEDCASEPSDELKTQRNEKPEKPMIELNSNDSFYCSSFGDQYRWYYYETLLPDSRGVIFPDKKGKYTVRAGNSGCWSDLSDTFYFQVSKVLVNEYSIRIFPNPVFEKLYIDLSQTPKLEAVALFDLQGKEIEVSNNSTSKNEIQELDLTDLSEGIYFLVLKIGESYRYQKLIKK
ncbi:MAG: T9SS type A sorting domain-containing protein [Flavobacteriales bacterium]|nr:T9SS type A sorting domain-containing protein [Flavobacteriales bacterium]